VTTAPIKKNLRDEKTEKALREERARLIQQRVSLNRSNDSLNASGSSLLE